MVIDTVIVEPDERRMALVWRTVLAKDDEVPLRAVEAKNWTHAERDAQRRVIEQYKAEAAELEARQAGGENG